MYRRRTVPVSLEIQYRFSRIVPAILYLGHWYPAVLVSDTIIGQYLILSEDLVPKEDSTWFTKKTVHCKLEGQY